VTDREAVRTNSTPISLPILRPSLIYRTPAPASTILRPSLTSSAMSSVDVVVPSPANLLVALTDFLMSVHTASFSRSS
jgi:hypothetical protein